MKFSIIFPTRERIELLKDLLTSLEKTTKEINDIEVLIAIDRDDFCTLDFVEANRFSFVKCFVVMRSLNFSRDYYTHLAKKSTGRWIITANDDCQFETPGWDEIAYDILKDKSSIIYGRTEDGLGEFRAHGHGDYCCFPLQGRGGFEALGYIFPDRIPTWGADIHTKNLYDKIESVIHLPIMIRHYCHHNKTRTQDHISKYIANHQVRFDMRPTYEDINKLLEAINQEKETMKV